MLIECVLERKEPVIIPIGNETYEFKEDALGRKVAEVWIESHIECFLAVKHLYRPARPLEKGEGLVVQDAPPPPTVTTDTVRVTEAEIAAAHAEGRMSFTDLPALRAEYKRVTGKNPFMGWNGAILKAKIEAAAHA